MLGHKKWHGEKNEEGTWVCVARWCGREMVCFHSQ